LSKIEIWRADNSSAVPLTHNTRLFLVCALMMNHNGGWKLFLIYAHGAMALTLQNYVNTGVYTLKSGSDNSIDNIYHTPCLLKKK